MTNDLSKNLFQCSNQWATRPSDERFTSLYAMHDYLHDLTNNTYEATLETKDLWVREADQDNIELMSSSFGMPKSRLLNDHSFNQLASRVGAPSGYLKTLPTGLAVEAMNYGLQNRQENLKLLFTDKISETEVRAITGPNYGRIYNSQIVEELINRFGDGVTGDFRVPGEFKKELDQVTKANTTLFCGLKSMFVFLADEKNRIELPHRRGNETGTLARGFFVWNSEVGDSTFGISTFLFDYVCSNRIVWGATQVKEFKLRHTSRAPEIILDELQPKLIEYSQASTQPILEAINQARNKTVDQEFLVKRFGPRKSETLNARHMQEESRPIESLWDISTALTAIARDAKYQEDRLELEREAGAFLDLAA